MKTRKNYLMAGLLLLGLFGGCSPDFNDLYVNRHMSACVEYFYNNSNHDIQTIEANTLLAYSLIYHGYLKDKKEDFCDVFDGVDAIISAEYYWMCSSGVVCTGEMIGNTVPPYIIIDRSMGSLMHELFHVYDVRHGILNTASHPKWEEKGYYNTSDEYMERYLPLE